MAKRTFCLGPTGVINCTPLSKKKKVNAIVVSHRCSFGEDEIVANDVKEIKTSNEFKRLVMHLPYGHLRRKKKIFLIVTHLYIVRLLCILLSKLSGLISMFLITYSCF